jgi:hypothetical protein
MMDAYLDLKPEIEAAQQARKLNFRPAVTEVFSQFNPMPEEALFLGVATDDLPVLLNIYDPTPGPLLIIGDSGAGKTKLLQTIAHVTGYMHAAEKLQFGAVTNRPDDRMRFENDPNNVGIFSVHHRSSDDFILSLASWAHGNKSSKQSVLLFLDGLQLVADMEVDTVQNLRWLLLRGPSRRVWPIVTLSTANLGKMDSWLSAFRTYIFGKVEDAAHIQRLNAENADLESLEAGTEFTLSEEKHWLRFWLPTLD